VEAGWRAMVSALTGLAVCVWGNWALLMAAAICSSSRVYVRSLCVAMSVSRSPVRQADAVTGARCVAVLLLPQVPCLPRWEGCRACPTWTSPPMHSLAAWRHTLTHWLPMHRSRHCCEWTWRQALGCCSEALCACDVLHAVGCAALQLVALLLAAAAAEVMNTGFLSVKG
jgi:hypothetical protein